MRTLIGTHGPRTSVSSAKSHIFFFKSGRRFCHEHKQIIAIRLNMRLSQHVVGDWDSVVIARIRNAKIFSQPQFLCSRDHNFGLYSDNRRSNSLGCLARILQLCVSAPLCSCHPLFIRALEYNTRPTDDELRIIQLLVKPSLSTELNSGLSANDAHFSEQ